jgi:hypothetical protein
MHIACKQIFTLQWINYKGSFQEYQTFEQTTDDQMSHQPIP